MFCMKYGSIEAKLDQDGLEIAAVAIIVAKDTPPDGPEVFQDGGYMVRDGPRAISRRPQGGPKEGQYGAKKDHEESKLVRHRELFAALK